VSIEENITRIISAKSSLKTAIEFKGVSVGDITLDGYAQKVLEIPSSYTSTTEIVLDQNSLTEDNIARLILAKSNLRAAIISKGV